MVPSFALDALPRPNRAACKTKPFAPSTKNTVVFALVRLLLVQRGRCSSYVVQMNHMHTYIYLLRRVTSTHEQSPVSASPLCLPGYSCGTRRLRAFVCFRVFRRKRHSICVLRSLSPLPYRSLSRYNRVFGIICPEVVPL